MDRATIPTHRSTNKGIATAKARTSRRSNGSCGSPPSLRCRATSAFVIVGRTWWFRSRSPSGWPSNGGVSRVAWGGHEQVPSHWTRVLYCIICYHTAMKGRSPQAQPDETLDAATDAVLVVSRALVGIAAQSLAATEAQITLPQYRALVVLSARGAHNLAASAERLGN